MKQRKLLFLISIMVLGIVACSKDETHPFDTRFIHIMENDASAVTVSDKASAVGTYNVYLSSRQFFDTVVVTYKITPGNGLVEGVDYTLLNTGNELRFLPGIYDMPIRIKWMPNPVDASRNNTLTIELVGNNKGIHLGLPGPDAKQKIFTITKNP
ncbi:MAG: hypothetical protein J7599_07195 [Niabella sp.]|nr:hypothetical protein [Niabella sp.]